MASEGSTKSVIVAMATNGAIAVAKLVGAALSGSASMFAEGLHSIADTGNEVLLFVGIKRADKPPDEEHSFGYGRERYFWSFVVATSLFLVGGVLSALEGIYKLMNGTSEEGGILIPLIILGVAAMFEGYSFSVAYRNFSKVRQGKPFFTTLLKVKDPTIITVLCEDSAALTGIAIAATGIILSYVTHDPLYDALGSILIGIVLAIVAFFLANESKSLLIGESALKEQRRTIREICESKPEVVKVIDLLTMHISPKDILVTLNLRFQPHLKTHEIEDDINDLEQSIRQQVPEVNRIFIEPHIG